MLKGILCVSIPLGCLAFLGVLLLSTGYVIFKEKSEALVTSTCVNIEHIISPTTCSYSCNCITSCHSSSSGTSCTTICQTCYYTCYDGFVRVSIGLYPIQGRNETETANDDRHVVNRDSNSSVSAYLQQFYPFNKQYSCFLNPCALQDSYQIKGHSHEFQCNSIQKSSTLVHFRIPNAKGFLISGIFFLVFPASILLVLFLYYGFTKISSNSGSSSQPSRAAAAIHNLGQSFSSITNRNHQHQKFDNDVELRNPDYKEYNDTKGEAPSYEEATTSPYPPQPYPPPQQQPYPPMPTA